MGVGKDENPSSGWTTTEHNSNINKAPIKTIKTFELSVTHKILRSHLEPMQMSVK